MVTLLIEAYSLLFFDGFLLLYCYLQTVAQKVKQQKSHKAELNTPITNL